MDNRIGIFVGLLILSQAVTRLQGQAHRRSQPHTSPLFQLQSTDPLLQTVETYISWGSLDKTKTPNCSKFQSVFGANRTWESPFTASEFFVNDVETSCRHLAQNVSWYSASLEAGKYLYPFYTERNEDLWKIGFVWTAVGRANEWTEVLSLKEYDFKIITTLWLQTYPNGLSYIFVATDFFWPRAESTFPTLLKELVDGYVSFQDGNCKTWLELFYKDVGMVTVSGEYKEYYAPDGLMQYCNKMIYMWNPYVHNVHHMSYSVDNYSGKADHVAFTWTRTGVSLGQVTTDEVLTVFSLRVNDSPTEDFKIFSADNFFQPPPPPPVPPPGK